MPETATVEEIEDIYFRAWKMGIKALAIYRDNCKVGQPLSDAKAKKNAVPVPDTTTTAPARAVRKRLPRQRESRTTSFTVGGADGYITAGSYPGDGLGEVFLKLGKQGSTLAGVMDAFSIAISVALQYGVPLETYVEKFTNMRFEPAGMTDDPDIRMAQSMMDYIFRRLALDYLPFETRSALGIYTASERQRQLETGSYTPVEEEPDQGGLAGPVESVTVVPAGPVTAAAPAEPVASPVSPSAPAALAAAVHSSAELFELKQGRTADAPLCLSCGIKMRPSGSCYVCEGCGSTSGCS
jgi:ribonucleoside-diphosphate reductase alpha chain